MAILKGNTSDDLTLKYLLENNKGGGGSGGVPSGGNQGEVLSKASSADYDTVWSAVAAGAKVHVGDDPPTDPDVTIWLDTDEQGAVIGSVPQGGVAGQVLAKASATDFDTQWATPLSMKLLWTNASPASAFAAQTVSLDLSGYDAVQIKYMAWTTFQHTLSMEIDIGDIGTLIFPTAVNAVRKCTVSSAGITFTGTDTYTSGNWSPSQNDSACIPYKIYGIKGISI